MTPPIHKAGVDFDFLVWVAVVLATLISQVVRASRSKPQRGPPAPPGARPVVRRPLGPPPAMDAQEELRNFLESLTGQSQRPLEPPESARPTPVFPTARTTAASVHAASAPPRVARQAGPVRVTVDAQRVLSRAPAAPQRPQPTPAAVPRAPARVVAAIAEPPPASTARLPTPLPAVPSPRADAYDLGLRSAGEQHATSLRQLLMADIKARGSLRKGIVLREILEAPLALRKAHRPGYDC